MSVTQVSEHTFEIGGMPAAVALPPPPAPPAPAPAAVPAPPPAVTAGPAKGAAIADKPPTARQLLAQMRARLREVKRALADKKALEQERDQLLRLIRAATTEIDNVRRIRAAG